MDDRVIRRSPDAVGQERSIMDENENLLNGSERDSYDEDSDAIAEKAFEDYAAGAYDDAEDADEAYDDDADDEAYDDEEADDEAYDEETDEPASPRSFADLVQEEGAKLEKREKLEGDEIADPFAATGDADAKEESVTIDLDQTDAKKTKKKSKAAIAVIIVAVVTVIALLIGGLIYIMRKPRIDMTRTVLSVNDVESNVAEFIAYYQSYSSYYSYYGQQTDADTMRTGVLDDLAYMDAVYKAALDEGIELTPEAQASIDEQRSRLTEAAESQSMTVDEMIEEYYGAGYNTDIYLSLLEKQAYVNVYLEKKQKEIEDGYNSGAKDAEIEAEYKENKAGYDLCDVSYCYFANDEDGDAQAKAKEVTDAVAAGTAFADAAKAAGAEAKPLNGYNYKTLESNFDAAIAAWIFGTDASGAYTAKAGAITTIESSGAVYVIYANAEPARNERFAVTVDYALVNVGTSELKSEEELSLEAKSKANALYKSFSEGTDKTVEGFRAAMGADGGATVDVFEDVTSENGMDAAVAAWVFDSARKIGDSTVIQTEEGSYVLFFTGKADKPAWFETIRTALASDAMDAWTEEFKASYKENVVIDDEAVAAAVNYMTETANKEAQK